MESTSHAYHTIFSTRYAKLSINLKKNPIFQIVNSTIFTHFTIFAIFCTNFGMQLKCKNIYLQYTNVSKIGLELKVIYPKYSKHWPYTVASTIDCGCSKMLFHGLFLSLFKLIPCPIHWIVYVLWLCPSLFKFHIWTLSSFSAAQNGRLCPDT